MSRRSAIERRSLAVLAFVAGGVAIVSAGGDPALASPDRWGFFRLVTIVPSLAAIGFFPGWYALDRARGLGTWTRVVIAILISALAAFGAGTLALALGGSLAWAARALAAVTVAGAAIAALGAARTETAADGKSTDAAPGAGARRAAVFLIAVWVGLVAALYLLSPELRARGDGWFHAAVAAHVAQVGLPPDDPWYAGQPLHYAWAMHVAIDVLVAGAPRGSTPFDLLAGWSLLAALALGASVIAAGAHWARAAGDSARAHAAGAWAFVLAVFVIHPLGFWIWLAESFIGHDRGVAQFVRPLNEGAGSTLAALASYLPHPSLAFFPDKFLIPTAFGLAYATVVTAIDALFLAPWGAVSRAAVAGVAILAAVVFHPLAGGTLITALGVAAVVELARRRRVQAGAIAVACASALILAAPYLGLVLRGRVAGAGPWIAFAPDMLLAALGTGVIVLAFAWPELRRAGGPFADGRGRIGLVALFWLVAAVTLGFVQRNETKFLSLGLLALALPAGGYAARHPVRATLALGIALPGVIMAVLGFAHDRGQQSLGARDPAPAMAQGYTWIAAHTSVRDAFLEPQPEGVRDPVRDLLVHGPRPLVWGGDSYASNWGYPVDELALRRRASLELAGGALTAPSVRELARRFQGEGKTLYAVERGSVRPPADAKPGTWTRVYDGPAFALDRLDQAPAAVASAEGPR